MMCSPYRAGEISGLEPVALPGEAKVLPLALPQAELAEPF